MIMCNFRGFWTVVFTIVALPRYTRSNGNEESRKNRANLTSASESRIFTSRAEPKPRANVFPVASEPVSDFFAENITRHLGKHLEHLSTVHPLLYY